MKFIRLAATILFFFMIFSCASMAPQAIEESDDGSVLIVVQ